MATTPPSQDDSTSSLLNRVAAGILFVFDRDLIVFANAAAADLLGSTPEAIEGTTLTRWIVDSSGDLHRAIAQAARPGAERAGAAGLEVRRSDRQVWIDCLCRPAESEGCVVTLLDATRRMLAEAELVALRDKLAESERARMRLRTIQEELVDATSSAGPGGGGGEPKMVGSSAALRRVREQVAKAAPTDATVLIQGETGSGKELVARSIHAESTRARGAFVAVNCAALPESLIESELFGHERGAFTGADRRRLGKFELADGGTLFLDEIAELPLAAQAKLLRVLQGGAFERVGGAETIGVDVRVVAATHRDLARRVERGLFREDLFYRLNVLRIDVPPLRDRREDLGALVAHLHAQAARRIAKPVRPVSERSMRRIMAYRWPGNIRELANAVERATLLADGPELEIELPESPSPDQSASPRGKANTGATETRDILLDLTIEQLQRLQIMHALETCGHRVFGDGGAAQKLEIHPNTLLSRMDKYGIPRPRLMRGEGDTDGA